MISYTIPHRLTRQNEYIEAERRNRYAAANIKKNETYLCSLYTPKIKIDYPVEIHLIWTVKNFANDPDNVAFGKKFILDGMTKSGLLPKDNLTIVKHLRDYYKRGSEEQVEVIIKKWEDNNE
jgi:Holliday junction resolvase RusA-like endonuclease